MDPIEIKAFVPAPPEEAWRVFTSAEAIMTWYRIGIDWHCPSASVDLRPGGRHHARVEARDGSFGFDAEGVYEEVDAPHAHALTLRLPDGRSARTSFAPEKGGTRVTTRFNPEADDPIDRQRDGWQAILDSYAAHVAAR